MQFSTEEKLKIARHFTNTVNEINNACNGIKEYLRVEGRRPNKITNRWKWFLCITISPITGLKISEYVGKDTLITENAVIDGQTTNYLILTYDNMTEEELFEAMLDFVYIKDDLLEAIDNSRNDKNIRDKLSALD